MASKAKAEQTTNKDQDLRTPVYDSDAFRYDFERNAPELVADFRAAVAGSKHTVRLHTFRLRPGLLRTYLLFCAWTNLQRDT